MSASFNDPAVQSMLLHFEQQLVEDMVGTFDPDPYRRKSKIETVPLSKKKIAQLEAAAALLEKYDALVEGSIPHTRQKRVWLETKEEYQNRLATLPVDRADWIRQQLDAGKKPPRTALLWDDDYRRAIGVKDVLYTYGNVTFPIRKRDES